MNSFSNPYTKVDKAKKYHFTFDADIDQVNLIKTINPSQGTIAAVGGLLLHKLITTLHERHITDITKSEEFRTFVANCRIVSLTEYQQLSGRGLLDSAFSGTVPNACTPNDGSRTSESHPNHSSNAPVSPDVQSGSASPVRRKGGKGK